MSFNKITIVGNLGRSPELRYTPQGTAVCEFSIATTEKKPRSEDVTTWFKCTAWGKTAENASKFLAKGSKAYVDGRLSQETWTDRDGVEKTTLAVNVSDIQYLSPKAENNNTQQPLAEATHTGTAPLVDDSDVPF